MKAKSKFGGQIEGFCHRPKVSHPDPLLHGHVAQQGVEEVVWVCVVTGPAHHAHLVLAILHALAGRLASKRTWPRKSTSHKAASHPDNVRAGNRLGVAQIDLAVRLQLIQSLPRIIEMASKPMEKIDSIRLFQVNGMPMGNSAGQGGNGGGAGGAGTLPEQVVNSALQYQVAKPIVDAIMKDAGLSNPSLTGITQSIADMVSMAPVAPLAVSEVPADGRF